MPASLLLYRAVAAGHRGPCPPSLHLPDGLRIRLDLPPWSGSVERDGEVRVGWGWEMGEAAALAENGVTKKGCGRK